MKQKQLLFLLALLMTAATGAWAQTGMINGLFSVSPTKRVYFSKGNLQYDGTNWKFAASQWEVLGANGTGATGTATNYPMDFFTWGNIDSPTYNGTTYYTENADLSGITDWGSRMGSGWYTLSKDEWLYLFGMESSNTDKSGHARYRKYFRATVNGVKGIVLLPDDLSGISDIPAESNRGTASNFAKTYTTDAWSAMESAGCVFLPTAGFRKTDASVSHVGWSGFYWESTAYDAGKAYTVGFDNTFVDPAGNFDRTFGFSVRLVIDQYYLTLADGTEDAAKWTATVGTSTTANPLPVGGLSEKDAVTLTYGGRLKVKSVTATTDAKPGPLATPLTIEAVTPGTIQVYIDGTFSTGMKYSVNGGTKTTITETTLIEGLKAGDKVQFYGNGTQTQVYGDNTKVSILGSGAGFQTKVYGNIMSLLDETGFATKTDLPNVSRVFSGLFRENATLIDASELLLPATELTPYCYSAMFEGCTSLTKAPKLPATTLAMLCYYCMFYRCTSLTSAYVKAAYTENMYPCRSMFYGNPATGAVLHTTSDNKASWEDVMGSGKEWENWTVADDWQE